MRAKAADQKTDWNLGETVVWVRTHDHDRVATMWDKTEFEAVAGAFFDWNWLPQKIVRMPVSETDAGTAATDRASTGQLGDNPAVEEPADEAGEADDRVAEDELPAERQVVRPGWPDDGPARPERILREIMRKVQTLRVHMTMIPAEVKSERSAVSAAQANDLELRITEDRHAPVEVWSRSQQTRVGVSPWFSSGDAIRTWPERSKKTAAVTGAILRRLGEISTPEAPLTKAEAWRRCHAEVPDAYPEAFRKAWAQLEPARKLGRGKHGPRAH